MSSSTFSAKEPSLGYFYQVQYGLLLLLNSKQEDNAKLLIIDSFKKNNLPMDFPDKVSLTEEELKKVKSLKSTRRDRL